MPPRITVVVPTYQGEKRIGTCLDDLAAQSLSPDLFEVVVVQNGPPTRTPEVVRAWAERHPQIAVRLLETEVASAQNARNIVLDGPTAEWITFVDDDDRLQRHYLAALWDEAAPGLVPSARVGSVVEGRWREVNENLWLTQIPREFLGRSASNADLWPMVHAAWGKLVERRIIGDVRFDTALKYADDTVFWMEVLARTDARFVLTDFRDQSAYLWVQREGSITRSATNVWEEQVARKLTAIRAMEQVSATCQDAADLQARRSVCEVFWTGPQGYLRAFPEQRREVRAAIRDSGITEVPWSPLLLGIGGSLAVLDPTDRDSLRRLEDDGEFATLVATRALGEREAEVREALRTTMTGLVTAPVTTGSWAEISALADEFAGFFRRDPAAAGTFTSVRSDSHSPVEHLLAAMVKVSRPELTWHAVVPTTLQGRGSTEVLVGNSAFDRLSQALEQADPTLAEVPGTLAAFAELVVATLADEVVARDDMAVVR